MTDKIIVKAYRFAPSQKILEQAESAEPANSPAPVAQPYTPAVDGDMAVCVVFFSPVGWQMPVRHLQFVLYSLVSAGYPTFVMELIRPGAISHAESVRKFLPGDQTNYFVHTVTSDNVMFAKENLQNMLAKRIPEYYKKLCFLDADIYFDTQDWYQKCSAALDNYDIVQPFETANWLNKNNQTVKTIKPAAAKIISERRQPASGKDHPGFGWAMRRDVFNAIGGYYELHMTGGGDISFTSALASQFLPELFVPQIGIDAEPMRTPSWRAYANRVKKLAPRISYLKNITAAHLYHGAFEKRLYMLRCEFLPTKTRNGEYPVFRRSDGLLEWRDPAHSAKLEQYFLLREEDS